MSLEDDALSLLELEEAIAKEASEPFRRAFVSMMATIETLWPGDDASPEAKRLVFKRLNFGRFTNMINTFLDVVLGAASTAMELGTAQGVEQAGLAGVPLPKVPFKAKVSEAVNDDVERGYDKMRHVVRVATHLAESAETKAQLVEAVTLASTNVARSRGIAGGVVNRSANEALAKVADTHDELVNVWHAERDACVKCLAYAGEVNTGKGYKGGLTFGDKPMSTNKVPSPPLHPHCRCAQYVIHRDAVQGVADALKREAKRSVLRGWSLPSESNTVRIRAADKLLNKGSTLPKSVKAYAAQAVKRGEFPSGRDFPGVR